MSRKQKPIAVVGIGAIMPDAHNADQFWQNILNKHYSIREVHPSRWQPDMFYHPDPSMPDKTYSKIGSWVDGYPFNPLEWGILIPPRILENMDDSQKWAIAASRQALMDYGYPERSLDNERVAVILGNAMAGEHHYLTNLRVHAPEFEKALSDLPAFKMLPAETQQHLLSGMLSNIHASTPPINEDTMPGELSNIIAGRVANVFNFSGPNFVTDAACASSLAALQSAIEGLANDQFDAVLTGGVDRNMGPGSFVKFSKIGALSPDGSRPYAAGANGFVMGEGAAVFLLKRLEDAERDGDKIYAVLRGVGSSSDGKGKGITAPNPTGQQLAIQRAWQNAGVNPASVGLIEGHGTSTRVGDRVETQSLAHVFGAAGLAKHSIGLGSVKSNIGHLKSAAGAAGLLKVIYALDKKILPPSANFNQPNPEINFDDLPFYVVTETQPWERPVGEIRRAGVSSFGFGGTNFHVVVEEYLPGLHTREESTTSSTIHAQEVLKVDPPKETVVTQTEPKTPSKQFVFLGAESPQVIHSNLSQILQDAETGNLPKTIQPTKEDLQLQERLVISYYTAEELLKKGAKALKGLETDATTAWPAYAAQGLYRGSGDPGKIAFLFPGQGSQYTNMLRDLIDDFPIIRETYQEADQVMAPLLGKPLTDYIFIDTDDEESVTRAEEALKDTTITQPAVLTANIAIMRLLDSHHIHPEMLIGHSLGEYAALVAASALTFKEALEIVSARGHAMSALEVEDNGCMAAVLAPIDEVQKIISTIDEYVVLANVNSPVQSVIGGETIAIDKAIALFKDAGLQAVKIPVSHAFHTRIVAPASDVLRKMIAKANLLPPQIPIAANLTGELYPSDQSTMVDMLADHISSPVQFVQGVQTLYGQGGRIFVEVGPKRVLNSLVKDILKDQDDITIVATNHPRKGGIESIYEALCQMYALGLGYEKAPDEARIADEHQDGQTAVPDQSNREPGLTNPQKIHGSVVISGAGLGLPGRDKHVFSDDNIDLILNGHSFIEPIPENVRQNMLEKRVTRLVKSDAGARMVLLDDLDQTVKLAGQHGQFNLSDEFGVSEDRVAALDITTQLAIAAGIEALRDAGIPLVMRYKETSTGSYLPVRWMLPEALADETGVIFGSAFPGLDELAEEAGRYYEHEKIISQIKELESVLDLVQPGNELAQSELRKRIDSLRQHLADLDYSFDRKFIFRVLTMGHSQFAEYIGARGPNTAVNAACATTTHALSIAEDWIRNGRCRRVIIVAGDDVSGGSLVSWVGTGLLASGATTTNGDLRTAALPFDRRRNGMIMGMGAAALVVESEDAVQERGMRGICEVLVTDTANSAFHGTRLEINHVSQIMQRLVDTAERRFGIQRDDIASKTMFMSHETYTPARGGSAAAEIKALRSTFGENADQVLIANTKGYTGHTMAVGIEDIVSVKALETGVVPPIAHLDENFEPDPDLGNLNLSRGGEHPIDFALRLGAGFGSQIAMAFLRRIPGEGERIRQTEYQAWLASAAGYKTAEIETVQRTLRIKDQGVPAQPAMKSEWVYGEGPSKWASVPEKSQVRVGAPTPVQAVEAQPEPVPVQVQSAVQPEEEEIKTFLLGLVSEKTGYPPEILDMDLDLEADLGIDTVKQAELFAAVREHFGIPRREDLMLVDYNTLQKVVGFVQESFENTPVVESHEISPAEVEPINIQSPISLTGIEPEGEETQNILRRVPTPILRPKLDLCLPTGVSLGQGNRVLVVEGDHPTGEALSKLLIAKDVSVLRTKTESGPAFLSQIKSWLAEGQIDGVYFLSAMHTEPGLEEMTVDEWHNSLKSRVFALFQVMQSLPAETFLISATNTGGLHGFYQTEMHSTGAGVSGFCKGLAQERPESLIKVIDFALQEDAESIANQLIQETLRDPAVVEVGTEDCQRYGFVIRESSWDATPAKTITDNPVILVTGGTAGIVPAVIQDMNSHLKGKYYLLGRSPLPAHNHPDLETLRVSGTEGLKQKWMQAMMTGGEKMTPVQMQTRIDAFVRSVATLDLIDAINSSGGTARYLVADITDPSEVDHTVSNVLQEEGEIDIVIHAAGYEHSRKIETKSMEEFTRTIEVKTSSFFYLYKALLAHHALPQEFILFSSVAGRFGNSGQTDYSAANDLLSKMAAYLNRRHSQMRVVTLDWGPWAEVGMATRGNTPDLMALAGIEMMNPRSAASLVYREIASGSGHEVVFAGDLGGMEEISSQQDPLDVAAANQALRAGDPTHVMLSSITGYDPNKGVTFEVTLDPNQEPFLHDHALNGTPLLPGVMGIEGFTVAAQHIASVLGSNDKTSLKVAELEDIRFLTPFKFYRNEPRHITWIALPERTRNGLRVSIRLESINPSRLVHDQPPMLHFTGNVYLTPAHQASQTLVAAPPKWNGRYTLPENEIYKLYFHGPAFQVLEGVQKDKDGLLGKLSTSLPPFTSQPVWLGTNPILIELCLQTAGIYEIGKTGALSLPQSIHKVRFYRRETNGVPIFAQIQAVQTEDGLQFNSRVIDEKGRIYLELLEYRTSTLPSQIEKPLLAPLERLLNEED